MLKMTGITKRFILMQLTFLACMISAFSQSFSNYEIVELININVLQIDMLAIENINNNKVKDWILSERNTILVFQDGNRNHTLIEQIKGINNVAKILQKGHNNLIGYECAYKRECGVYQINSRNYSEIKQYANQNKSETMQNGNDNDINILQNGETGFGVDYKSYANNSSVTQIGNRNMANISQTLYP